MDFIYLPLVVVKEIPFSTCGDFQTHGRAGRYSGISRNDCVVQPMNKRNSSFFKTEEHRIFVVFLNFPISIASADQHLEGYGIIMHPLLLCPQQWPSYADVMQDACSCLWERSITAQNAKYPLIDARSIFSLYEVTPSAHKMQIPQFPCPGHHIPR